MGINGPQAGWHSILFSTSKVSQCQAGEQRRQEMKCDPWQSIDKLLKRNESRSIVWLNAMPRQYPMTRRYSVCVHPHTGCPTARNSAEILQPFIYSLAFSRKDLRWLKKKVSLSTRICFMRDFVLYKSRLRSSMMSTQEAEGTALWYKVQRPNHPEAFLSLCSHSPHVLVSFCFYLFSCNQKLAWLNWWDRIGTQNSGSISNRSVIYQSFCEFWSCNLPMCGEV